MIIINKASASSPSTQLIIPEIFAMILLIVACHASLLTTRLDPGDPGNSGALLVFWLRKL
jgi:hypothetical protein